MTDLWIFSGRRWPRHFEHVIHTFVAHNARHKWRIFVMFTDGYMRAIKYALSD